MRTTERSKVRSKRDQKGRAPVSGLEQRLWVEQDMNNFNVAGITDNTGAVVEHYRYDPYGGVHIFDGS